VSLLEIEGLQPHFVRGGSLSFASSSSTATSGWFFANRVETLLHLFVWPLRSDEDVISGLLTRVSASPGRKHRRMDAELELHSWNGAALGILATFMHVGATGPQSGSVGNREL
jgi:hypothetical protein